MAARNAMAPDTEDGPVERLFVELYDELKRIAHRQLNAGDMTLQTTGLVHEACLKLARAAVVDEVHMLNLASRAMRQVSMFSRWSKVWKGWKRPKRVWRRSWSSASMEGSALQK